MKSFIISIWMLLLAFAVQANDGVFYVAGNQLIPITETKIAVKKEILNIKREGTGFLVCVYYEMFNPDEARDIEVGFEASSPGGEKEGTLPVNGRHPYMYEFTVNMNQSNLEYQVAIVDGQDYYKNGKYILADWPKKTQETADDFIFDYRYVYHFKAHFKKGLNTIMHTYRFEQSGSVMNVYELTYVLSAAMRWGNKQIDDFTLNIDVGDYQTIQIPEFFFQSNHEWLLLGKGKQHESDTNYEIGNIAVFHIQKGSIQFHKLNFVAKDELVLYCSIPNKMGEILLSDSFNYKKQRLDFQHILPPFIAMDELSLKILKNLPYARRGYVFKSKELQDYFSKMPWYSPDPSYIATLSELTDEEQKWLKTLKI